MEIGFSFAVIVAIVMGLVEVAKKIGLEVKFAPVAALICGIGLSILAVAGGLLEANLVSAVFMGIIAGLSAVGLYSGTTNTTDGVKSLTENIQQ